jgi:predicted Zn finger-like uncharacterized protein
LRGVAKNAMPEQAMRVSCPNCSTEYEVPDAALSGRRRTLLCERCGHRWRRDEVTPGASGRTQPRLPWDVIAPDPPPRDLPAGFAAARAEPRLGTVPEAAQPEAGQTGAGPAADAPEDAPEEAPAWRPERAASGRAPAEAAATLPTETPATGAPVEPGLTVEAAASEPGDDRLPLFLTEPHPDDTVLKPGASASDGQDRFADLVYAARNNRVEYEPLVPPDFGQRATSPVAIILIIALLLVAAALWDHALLARTLPATRPFFARLGLH